LTPPFWFHAVNRLETGSQRLIRSFEPVSILQME